MSDPVTLTRSWPTPSVALDDEQLVEAYGGADAATLRVNFVASLDGAATVGGRSGALGDEADRRVFETLRRLCDVVLVGAGTVRAEGYGGMRVDDAAADWRLRHGLDAQPLLAIVSGRLDLDPSSPVFTEAVRRPLVLTSSRRARQGGKDLAGVAELVECGDTGVEAAEIPEALRRRGLGRILCEGGPTLLGALARAGVVDELCLTLSPRLVGGPGPRITRSLDGFDLPLRPAHVLVAGPTLLLRYVRE